MKNIHILPTDKPSRLCIDNSCNELNYSEVEGLNSKHITNQNIFITSDEEIKEGYVLNTFNNTVYKIVPDNSSRELLANPTILPICAINREHYSKIILTTDQDLIADGVQAIEDEFLEWFVQNPSCEFADVNDWLDDNGNIAFGGDKRYQLCNHLYNKQIILKEEPQQETLEDAAKSKYGTGYGAVDSINAFIEGAKWQQERMYSEKDLEVAFFEGQFGKYSFNDWLEQFKKK